MLRTKALIIALFVLTGAVLFSACTDLPVVPVPVADEDAVAVAVEATLTAVAASPDAEGAATPTPAQSQQTVQLPVPFPDWQSFADKPATSKGQAAAPVVLVEYSDFQCP